MSIQISQDYSSMVNFARCKCLGANVLRGPKQIPWDGKLNMIINFGLIVILFLTTENSGNSVMLHCLKKEKRRKSLRGWYATEDGHTTSVAHWLEEDDFRKNGGVMNHETVESLSVSVRNHLQLITLDLVGF